MKNRINILFLVLVVLTYGCVKDVDEPFESAGLDTVPSYRQGESDFSTKDAVKKAEAKKVKKAKKEKEALKKKDESLHDIVETSLGTEREFDILDPWVSPPKRSKGELPKALRNFPTDFFGYPDWNKGLEQGLIKPRGTLDGSEEEKIELEYTNILIEINDPRMGDVLFPHMKHVVWLSCNNCHPKPFKKKRGATRFSMNDIWAGQYCGKCHGKVAFMPKGYENCQRCHSQKNKR